MAEAKGLFVTGTDTGVGKTLVSCALLQMLRDEGLQVAGFKPVSCGTEAGRMPGGNGQWLDGGIWADAEALREAAGGTQTLDAVSPLRFKAPLAPTLAAKAEGRTVELDRAREKLAELKASFDAVVVEGVGGWLVPLDDKTLAADFAAELKWPVLVVARTGLGTINHTLLTVREIRRSGLKLAGVILSDSGSGFPQPGAVEEIERIAGLKVLAVLPYVDAAGPAAVKLAAKAFSTNFTASNLLQ